MFEEEDDFVKSLNLTDEKILEDLESMKSIEGFPVGDVEDILELSEIPYYTAFPNPYIKSFIDYFGTVYDEDTDVYDVEPFVGDVNEGKNNQLYMAHSYHTKVPYKAIIKFIDHYTEVGDLIFDGFCGTGMAGVASQLSDRIPILSDISPIATFISNSYNKHYVNNPEIDKIIDDLKKEYLWMYETNHGPDGSAKGIINHVIWSEIFVCPFCGNEIIFWDSAVTEDKKVSKIFKCSKCDAEVSKNNCKHATKTIKINNEKIEVAKEIPALINYTYKNQRYEKVPDDDDLSLIDKIENMKIPYWYPTEKMLFKGEKWGDTWRAGVHQGIIYTNQFYYKRTLFILSAFYDKIKKSANFNNYFIYFTSILQRASKLFRWSKNQAGPLSGTLYIASLKFETSIFNLLKNKYKIMSIFEENSLNYKNHSIITTQSTSDLSNIPNNSIDYIFVDPPFGSNLMYSELNFIWESWLKCFTNNEKEAIISNKQNKFKDDYKVLMLDSFTEMFKILKPNRWITVEFHNSKSEIWNIIREAITKSGFVIAQVAVLNKKQGSFKQVISPGAVKNDLVINAYKPNTSFSNSFKNNYGVNLESEFLELHLNKLPVNQNIERTEQMLYSKYLAQYFQNDFDVRLDLAEFSQLLKDNFVERDNYWFTYSQVVKYDELKKSNKKIGDFDLGQTILGISDEKTALIWLYSFLKDPKTYDEIYNDYTKKLMVSQDKIPELKTLLYENFVTEDGKYRVPSDIKKNELEKLRIKRLSDEFNNLYDEIQNSKSKVKFVRKEALIYGLTELYKNKEVEKIILISNKLDKTIIEADEDISDIINWAKYK